MSDYPPNMTLRAAVIAMGPEAADAWFQPMRDDGNEQ